MTEPEASDPSKERFYDKHARLWMVRCRGCGHWLTQLAFRKNAAHPTRLDTHCRDCRNLKRHRQESS